MLASVAMLAFYKGSGPATAFAERRVLLPCAEYLAGHL
jgi:hypothetical protein